MNYDVIGDVHGHSEKLKALLTKLGYRERQRAWRHSDPSQTAIFVGDFIDRGPGQLETMQIVRSMLDSGTALAVMGNHEFNAIGYHTPDPTNPGEYVRPHTASNVEQHAEFVGATAGAHQEHLDWFLTLPLWLELDGLRVIHACWHHKFMSAITPLLGSDKTLDIGLVVAASRKRTPEHQAIEALLKGPELKLPGDLYFLDKSGLKRTEARVRWWDGSATTYRQTAICDDATRRQLPTTDIPEEFRLGYSDDKPVFFGHYWFSGVPEVLSTRAACVDYSAGKAKGPLVAYRWQGEQNLSSGHFTST